LPGSIANGGRLFDDWQVQTGRTQAISNPTYPKTSYYFNVPSETWRCKECHGWDYKGDKGQNAKGNHFTGIKGLREMAGADPQKIVGILRSSVHLFGNVMKYRDLLDLANFVSYGQIDMDKVIDPSTGKARGDAAQGAGHYRTMCIGCHGSEGHFVAKRALGRIAKDEPWHAVHTIMNGHPDDYMPALRELDLKVISDILAYAQTLPTKR
jgi:mono/diheme cytochrome c family protein